MNDELPCPVCHNNIPKVADWPTEMDTSGGQIVLSLASAVYECPQHGHWRIYVSGAHRKVEPKPNKT